MEIDYLVLGVWVMAWSSLLEASPSPVWVMVIGSEALRLHLQ